MDIKERIIEHLPIATVMHKIRNGKLKNKDYTLFTPNCLGGILYHITGQQFKSPTINMRINTIRDFMKFLKNIDYYLAQPIVFADEPEYSFPIGYVGDIKIYFNHYHSHDEVVQKWEERKKRINWDNVYIMATDYINPTASITREELLEFATLMPCKNIVIFTQERHDDIPYCFYLGKKKIHTIMNKSYLTGLREFEMYFDYVGWLNSTLNDKSV